MTIKEKEMAQSAVCAFLSGKVLAVEKALDEMPLLRIRANDTTLSTRPAEMSLRGALEGYEMGPHTNALAKQKPDMYAADSLISHILSRLSCEKRLDTDDVENTQEHLEKVLSLLLDVYAMEETRSRVYQRLARPLPKNRRKPPTVTKK